MIGGEAANGLVKKLQNPGHICITEMKHMVFKTKEKEFINFIALVMATTDIWTPSENKELMTTIEEDYEEARHEIYG